MAISLRIILIVVSLITCIYIARKLKKSQIQLMDTVFWIIVAFVFVIMALFPQLVNCISGLMGFMASVNFVFLVMIFLVLIRCFLLSIRVSQLEDKVRNLVEEIAIRENLDNRKDD
jgi:hypothetical protein